MARNLDLLIQKPPEGHIEWGVPFVIPPGVLENTSFHHLPVEVQPEVTVVNDDAGNPLTMKVVFHIDPPLNEPISGEAIKSIALGSFGQDDPLRLYYTSLYAAKILAMPGYLETKVKQAMAVYQTFGAGELIRLDELLYTCLNACFLAKPDSSYGEGNIHNIVDWAAPPPAIMAEIDRRVKGGLPLNYQYLAHVIENGGVPELGAAEWAPLITLRADDEQRRSTEHKLAYDRGAYGINRNQDDSYDNAATTLAFADFEVEFEGVQVVNNRVFEWINTSLDLDQRLVSDIPAVNAANKIIKTIMHLLVNQFDGYGVTGEGFAHTRLPIVGDYVRETLVRRIYAVYSRDDSLLDMSLAQFASQVYQLGLNNSDPNLLEFLRNRDDSEARLRQQRLET